LRCVLKARPSRHSFNVNGRQNVSHNALDEVVVHGSSLHIYERQPCLSRSLCGSYSLVRLEHQMASYHQVQEQMDLESPLLHLVVSDCG
jgi:hypothetical protein